MKQAPDAAATPILPQPACTGCRPARCGCSCAEPDWSRLSARPPGTADLLGAFDRLTY